MAVEIKVPTLGESVTEATVAKWFKAAGDAVAVDEALTINKAPKKKTAKAKKEKKKKK